jgi:FkbM family methyltransferase
MIREYQINANPPFKMRFDLHEDLYTEKTILSLSAQGKLHDADAAIVMIKALSQGDTAFDVGAHSGFFSVLMANLVGPNGQVVSFEPHDGNAKRLRANLTLNDLTNVLLVEKAVTDHSGEVTFYSHQSNDGGHAIWDIGVYTGHQGQDGIENSSQPRRTMVPATTLDSEWLAIGASTPRLIKIDVEGAEFNVLRGARNLLASGLIPFVIVELHDFALEAMGTTQIDLRAFMSEFGYECFALYDDGQLPKLIPPGVFIQARRVCNILFTRQQDLAALWPVEVFDPACTISWS